MRPIIATNICGLFLKSSPWKDAHKQWIDNIVKETGDDSFKQWLFRTDYFEGVNLAMSKLMPDATKEERVREARKRYMELVIENIKQNKEKIVNNDIVEYFKSLKEKYKIALITTNTEEFIHKILSIAGLKDLFDIVEACKMEEEDDKVKVFERFVKDHGRPAIFFGSTRQKIYDYCRKNNIKCVAVNLGDWAELNVKTVHNLEEIKKIIENL